MNTLYTIDELAHVLKLGDKVAGFSTLDENVENQSIIVGKIHKGDSHDRPNGYWVEPEGSNEYTYWLPIENIKWLNGQQIEIKN